VKTTKGKRTHTQTVQRRRAMNEEYLKAKFDLCLDQAEKNIKEEEIALAIKNLERANSAMARLFGLEEETDD
jgi:hypothetical protein